MAKIAGIVQCNAIIVNCHAVAESVKQIALFNKPNGIYQRLYGQDESQLHNCLAAEYARHMKNLEANLNTTSFGKFCQSDLDAVSII